MWPQLKLMELLILEHFNSTLYCYLEAFWLTLFKWFYAHSMFWMGDNLNINFSRQRSPIVPSQMEVAPQRTQNLKVGGRTDGLKALPTPLDHLHVHPFPALIRWVLLLYLSSKVARIARQDSQLWEHYTMTRRVLKVNACSCCPSSCPAVEPPNVCEGSIWTVTG